MVQFYDAIPAFVVPWMKEQKMFWVASAPLSGDGHVNVSPKGVFDGNFSVVNERQVWYEDLTGSGVETISHLRENRRVTIMFCAFDGPPRICRLFGKGTVYEFGTPEYDALIPPTKRQPGSRSVIFIDVHKVSTSCGYSIPFYAFKGYRLKLHGLSARLQNTDNAAEQQQQEGEDTSCGPATDKGLKHYWKKTNSQSLDGLPGLNTASESKDKFHYIDPKTLRYKMYKAGDSDGWVNMQTAIAFAVGVVMGGSVLKAVQQRM